MNKEFKTDNLSLAPYLLNHGLRYLYTQFGIGKNGKQRIIFVFDDENNIGKDLERSFLNSDEKRYKDALHYFRNQIKICNEKYKENK